VYLVVRVAFWIILLVATRALAQDQSVASNPPLPQRFGAFVRESVEALAIPAADRELYREYRCRATYRAVYANGNGERMTLDAFRFADAEGAHAAYLASRPAHGVSPLIWQVHAVVGGGITVMEYRNYMLRFHGALPGISSAMEEMLAALPELTADSA